MRVVYKCVKILEWEKQVVRNCVNVKIVLLYSKIIWQLIYAHKELSNYFHIILFAAIDSNAYTQIKMKMKSHRSDSLYVLSQWAVECFIFDEKKPSILFFIIQLIFIPCEKKSQIWNDIVSFLSLSFFRASRSHLLKSYAQTLVIVMPWWVYATCYTYNDEEIIFFFFVTLSGSSSHHIHSSSE